MDFIDDIFEAIPDEYDKFDGYVYALKKYGYDAQQRKYGGALTEELCLTINDVVHLSYDKKCDIAKLHAFAGYPKKIRMTPHHAVKNPIHMLRILANWSVDMPKLVAKTLQR